MTDEELREIVREELTAHDSTSPFNEQRRELIRFAAWALGAGISAVLALLLLWARLVVYPEMDARIERHGVDARERMDVVAAGYVKSAQLDALKAELSVKQARSEEQLIAIRAQLDRIEAQLARR